MRLALPATVLASFALACPALAQTRGRPDWTKPVIVDTNTLAPSTAEEFTTTMIVETRDVNPDPNDEPVPVIWLNDVSTPQRSASKTTLGNSVAHPNAEGSLAVAVTPAETPLPPPCDPPASNAPAAAKPPAPAPCPAPPR